MNTNVFNENSLREAIAGVWGEYGAHIDVFDRIVELAKGAKQEQTATVMKWAYKVKVFQLAPDELEQPFVDLGAQGWELVSAVATANHQSVVCFFKRQATVRNDNGS